MGGSSWLKAHLQHPLLVGKALSGHEGWSALDFCCTIDGKKCWSYHLVDRKTMEKLLNLPSGIANARDWTKHCCSVWNRHRSSLKIFNPSAGMILCSLCTMPCAMHFQLPIIIPTLPRPPRIGSWWVGSRPAWAGASWRNFTGKGRSTGNMRFHQVFWAIKYMDSKAFPQIFANQGDPAKFCRELVESGRTLHYQVENWYTVQKNLLENGDTPWRFHLCTFTVLKCQIWVCPVCLLWAMPKTPWSMPRPLLSIFVRHYIIQYPRQGRFPLKNEQSAWW